MGGCLAHAPCELGELESLETSVALAAERVGRVGLSRNPPRTGGGGESGESVAAKGRVGCSGALGPLGAATPAELGPSGAKQRLIIFNQPEIVRYRQKRVGGECRSSHDPDSGKL